MSNKDNVADNGVSYAHLLPHLRPGSPRGICTACGRGFSSDTTFDRHQKFRDEKIICRDPKKLGFVLGEEGFWKNPTPVIS